jgi:hypothetical protein
MDGLTRFHNSVVKLIVDFGKLCNNLEQEGTLDLPQFDRQKTSCLFHILRNAIVEEVFLYSMVYVFFAKKISELYYHRTVVQSTPAKQEIATRSLRNHTTPPSTADCRRAAASAAVAPAQRRDLGLCSRNIRGREVFSLGRRRPARRRERKHGLDCTTPVITQHRDPPKAPVQTARITGNRGQHLTAPPPDLPQQEQELPCHDEERDGGQNLLQPAAPSA